MPPPWLSDARLAQLFHYWCMKRNGRAMPARADIDPTELSPAILPHLALTEVVRAHGRLRFRFRLSGTAINEGAGIELTGHFVDEVNANPNYAAYIESLYRKTLLARRPVFSSSAYVAARGRSRRATKRLMCPLAADGEQVDMFVTVQIFEAIGRGDPPSMAFASGFDPGTAEVADCPPE
jgi:hypothetical protein